MQETAFINMNEMAALVSIHPTTIRRGIKANNLPVGFPQPIVFGGGKVLFRRSDAMTFVGVAK